MEKSFLKVKNYLLDLKVVIDNENEANGTFIIRDENRGIFNMIIAVAEPILIIEQKLFTLKNGDAPILTKLLIKNRDIIHGALALGDDSKTVIYRDTLELENLDFNELEATLTSLELFLSEFAEEIINYSK